MKTLDPFAFVSAPIFSLVSSEFIASALCRALVTFVDAFQSMMVELEGSGLRNFFLTRGCNLKESAEGNRPDETSAVLALVLVSEDCVRFVEVPAALAKRAALHEDEPRPPDEPSAMFWREFFPLFREDDAMLNVKGCNAPSGGSIQKLPKKKILRKNDVFVCVVYISCRICTTSLAVISS